jgi:hypothetical protein
VQSRFQILVEVRSNNRLNRENSRSKRCGMVEMQAIGFDNRIDGIRPQFNLPWADILIAKIA